MSEGVVVAASPPGAAAAAGDGGVGAPAAGGGDGDGGPEAAAAGGEVRCCSECRLVWNRQQTWLCAVPLFIGFVGLGLSLMLLQWIVVGSVQEYVPTELINSKGIEQQDPFFLSKPSAQPKASRGDESSPAATATATATAPVTATARVPPNRSSSSPRLTTRAPPTARFPPGAPRGGPLRTASPPRSSPAGRHSAATVAAVPFSTTTTFLLLARPAAPGGTQQPLPGWPTATVAATSSASSASSSPSGKTYLQDSAPSWTLAPFHEASATSPPGASTEKPKHRTTTYSTEQSEHFKPCKDKDLAYCLNDGECFVIETLTGSHKHCRCKEGYQGVRCDQFLPKTDSILSDPTDHLGIEFMESAEVYQRQVLSISCIVFGIVIVGMICAAFYFKTKKQTKQIQEQMKETQIGKTYSLNASCMMAKSEPRAQSRVQLQNYSTAKRQPEPVMEKMMESSFSGTRSFPEALSADRESQPMKPHRSLSSCCSPGQRSSMLHRNAFRRTPPLPRGRFNGMTGPAYQQLEESRITDQDAMPCQGLSTGLKIPQNASINMQLPSRETTSNFNHAAPTDAVGYSSPRASSVPIIPSMGLDEACMHTQNVSDLKGLQRCKNSYSTELINVSAPASSCLMTEQQEVKILLETVQEQIRILTDSKRSENFDLLASARPKNNTSENTAFLPMSPTVKLERETQFVLQSEPQRDLPLIK